MCEGPRLIQWSQIVGFNEPRGGGKKKTRREKKNGSPCSSPAAEMISRNQDVLLFIDITGDS